MQFLAVRLNAGLYYFIAPLQCHHTIRAEEKSMCQMFIHITDQSNMIGTLISIVCVGVAKCILRCSWYILPLTIPLELHEATYQFD